MFKLKPIASSVALSLMTGIAVAAAPGGAILQNKVIATYSDIGGKTYTAESNIVEISIREVRKATLTITQGAEQQVAMIPSSKVYSVHTLTNNGNVSETFALAAANLTEGVDTLDATALKIYLDANGNGVLDSGETTPITSTTLAAGASVKLIVESVLPAAIAVDDVLKVSLDATDSKGNTASSTSADGSPDLTDNTATVTFKNSNLTYEPVVWQQTAGGNCHAYAAIGAKTMTWTQAKAEAETQMHNGKIGHLATVTDAQENAFIKNSVIKSAGSWWLGAKKSASGAPFTWSTGETFSYTNWNSGEPNGPIAAGDAIEMYSTGLWNDLSAAGANGNRAYVIEFDTDCDLPKVAVELEGAKDVECDGTADEAFGTARLADMYSGECAILRTRATNGGKSLAKGVDLHYSLPQYASYVAGSLMFDSAAKTDAADADVGKYDAALKKILVNTGDLAAGTTSPDAQFSVKID